MPRHSTKVPCVCRRCGKSFVVTPYYVTAGRGRFCSKLCAGNGQRRRQPITERFFSHVNKDGPIQPHCPELGPCWLWTGPPSSRGIGHFRVNSEKKASASRFSWELHHGPIPDGLWVLHRCDNGTFCVRPDHLFLGTHADNMADMVAKGRQAKGETHPFRLRPESRPLGERVSTAKLTAPLVQEIRCEFAAGGVTKQALAVRHRVSACAISNAINRITWQHVP